MEEKKPRQGTRAGTPRAGVFLTVFLLLGGLVLAGCGYRPSAHVAPGVDMKGIREVGVLPMDNLTGEKGADEKVRQAVMSELLAHGIRIVEPGEVNSVLIDLQIRSLRTLTAEEMRQIGGRLHVDAIVAGAVSAYEMHKGSRVTYPEVSIHLTLYDANTGHIIASSWHNAGGASFSVRHFGAEPLTVSETARKVVKEAVDVLF
ncbi:MAG: hypothetical protein P8Y39_02620 [Nitrospirota bacterium]